MFKIETLSTEDGTAGYRFRVYLLSKSICSGFFRRHPTKNKWLKFARLKVFNQFSIGYNTLYVQRLNAKKSRRTSKTFVTRQTKWLAFPQINF
jgi:hypothetical protein